MKSNSNVWAIVLAVVAVLIAIAAWASVPDAPASQEDLGGTTAGFEDARGGFKINGSFVLKAPATGTATTSLTVGCVQGNATSTATPVKQVFSPLGATSTFAGTTYWVYGTCP